MQCILIDFVTQEVDSDDEWQGLVEATDTTKADVTAAHSLMGDKTFLNRLKSRLHRSSVQLLEARLEGASRLRPVLRIVINIITAPDRLVLAKHDAVILPAACDINNTLQCVSINNCFSDQVALVNFLKTLQFPSHVMTLLESMLEQAVVLEQAWCQQILVDLIMTVNAYLASNTINPEAPDSDESVISLLVLDICLCTYTYM